MSHADAVLDFRVPSDPHLARVVRDGVADFARAHGVEASVLAHFLTALGEAIANAMEHAKADAPIAIQVRLGGDRLVATVRDAGVGFSSAGLLTAELPPVDAERGRGIAIMRRCSDIFEIDSAPGRGTAVLVGRYLRASQHTENVA